RLSKSKIAAALNRANRRDIDRRAAEIQAALRASALRQPPAVQSAFAAIAAGEVRLISVLNREVAALGEVVGEHFGRHPDAQIHASQPGLGVLVGARVLADFGADPDRYATAKARKNYAGTSPIPRVSGTKKKVLARYARNDRLGDAVQQWAFCALRGSPGARAYYKTLRARNIGHQAALRQLANRLVGVLHGCLKDHAPYDESIAWAHHNALQLDKSKPGMSAAVRARQGRRCRIACARAVHAGHCMKTAQMTWVTFGRRSPIRAHVSNRPDGLLPRHYGRAPIARSP